MGRDTDKDWVKVAEENPYWAVICDERFKGKDLTSAERDVFFESAEGIVEQIFSVIRKHFAPDFAPARSLEFGCGVGRMLVPIARRSGEAIGVDVAPRMMELARRHLRESNISNARVISGDDPIMQGTGLFDYINSLAVLQHVPPERGYRIIVDLLRLLRPGGVATLHVSFARGEKLSLHAADKYLRRDGAISVREGPRAADVPEGTILMFDYDLNQIFVLAAEAGMQPILAFPTGEPDTHLGVWLYMRKP